jgi:hypothetical protein
VAELYNFSQNGGYVVGPSFNSYPTRSTSSNWRTDGSFQTTIVVENTEGTDDRLSLRLYSEHGLYSKSFPVSAGSLLKINLRDLQQKAVRDDNGAILADTSGIMSLVASQGIRSKLSFGKIIHSADLSEYIGLPANQCDYVSSIAMWVDTSSTMPFPVMKTYYWTQSGPVDENNFGTQSSNSSWAQVSNDGSGDVVTLSVPDDGFVHQIALNPFQPTEDVTFCDACSAGDVTVSPTTIGAKTVNLLSSTCTVDPGTHQPTLVGGWGSPGCALSGTSPGFLLLSGGSCVVNGSKNCYQDTTPSCVQTFCPGDTREVDGSCTRFLDQFPVVSSTSPAGCSL